LVDAKVIICFERAMSFVQKEDVLIVLDETQLGLATFVLPKFHHLNLVFLMFAIEFGARNSKTKQDLKSGAIWLQAVSQCERKVNIFYH